MTISPHPKAATQRIREDIDPASTWLVSDSHFGHDNIVGFCHRPEDHEQVMIAEWRKEVPDDATVLHLGDLQYARGPAFFKNIVAKELTGSRKLLIRGNHDRNNSNFYKQAGFTPCRPFSILYSSRPLLCRACDGEGWVGGTFGEGCRECNGLCVLDYPWKVSFSHYPWKDSEDGRMDEDDLRVHGHIHNNGYSRDAFVPFLKQHVNISVEQTKYRPVNLKLLLDAVLLGEYPETTEEQIQEARTRRDERAAGR